MNKTIKIYFAVVGALFLIAQIPGVLVVAFLLFFLPGLVLFASGTLLIYSASLLPAYLLFHKTKNIALSILVAVGSVAALSIGPHYIGQYMLSRVYASDFSIPVQLQPRSFELPGDWQRWSRPIRRTKPPRDPHGPLCNALCQQLLFSANADAVVAPAAIEDHRWLGPITDAHTIRIHPDGTIERLKPLNPPPEKAVAPQKKMWRFRLERRDFCPDTISYIRPAFVRQVIDGRCLIEELVDDVPADVVMAVSTEPSGYTEDRSLCERFHPFGFLLFESVAEQPHSLLVSERKDGEFELVERKSALKGKVAPTPFYLGLLTCPSGSDIPDLRAGSPTVSVQERVADPVEILNRRYGFSLDDKLKPPAIRNDEIDYAYRQGDEQIVAKVLAKDYQPDEFIPETQAIFVADYLRYKLQETSLTADDLALVKTALHQRAFTLSLRTEVARVRNKNYDQLEAITPDMAYRMTHKESREDDLAQSLDVLINMYPADLRKRLFDQACSDIPYERKKADKANFYCYVYAPN
jgi:hypothetical protein